MSYGFHSFLTFCLFYLEALTQTDMVKTKKSKTKLCYSILMFNAFTVDML